MQQAWWVYMITTKKGRLYTGISTDVERRFSEHTRMALEGKGPGAKFFRQDHPVKVCWREAHPDRASASKREYQVKALSRPRKLQLLKKL